MNNEGLYLPGAGSSTSGLDVRKWYGNIRHELTSLALEPAEREKFESYYADAGLLRRWRRSFFEHHYSGPLLRATNELFAGGTRPRILDLGCGTGTQSLLFAILGAEVISVDLDATSLSVLEKRKLFYEKLSGRRLEISIKCADVFALDVASFAPLDGIYSLFAFNMMQPSSKLLGYLCPYLSEKGVLVIQDGNRRHFFNAVFRRRNVAAADELRRMLEENACGTIQQTGTYAIPPIFWSIVPGVLLEPLDRWLARSEFFAVSYLHVARKG